jgi:hypothetical protein
MASKNILIIILIFLTALNVFIFINRDSFQYLPFVTYNTLYNGKNADPLKWNNFNSQYSQSEKLETKQITDSLVKGQKATIEKVFIIANYLHTRFKNQQGKPTKELSISSPLTQYKKLCGNVNEKLWCGTWAQLFSYFCFSQGIICRYIEIMHPGDHHVMNECYLPESKEWVMMDLTFDLLLVQQKSGDYLNVVSFKNNIGQSSSLFAINNSEALYQPDLSITPIQNYYNNKSPIYYYHSLATDKVYSLGSKLVRYFLPISWYKIYDDQGKSNMLYYIKVTLFLMWLLALFVLVMPLKILKND